MAPMTPFSRLTGTLEIWIGPYGTAIPDVDDQPTSAWRRLANTDGDQELKHGGTLTYFRDNEHQGPVKAVRPEEDVSITATIVSITAENYAAILHQVSQVQSIAASGGVPQQKVVPLKRGANPPELAVLFRGQALSPYGALPGQYVLPRAVIDGEPSLKFAKDGSPGLAFECMALDDDAQSDPDLSMGWLAVQEV